MSPVALPSIVTLCPVCGRWAKGLRVWRASDSHTTARLIWELGCRCTVSSRNPLYEMSAAWRPDGLDHVTFVPVPAVEVVKCT